MRDPKLLRHYCDSVLEAIRYQKQDGQRHDAQDTAIFARQLEHVMARTYDVLYPANRAREFIPLDSSVPSGAESFTYRQWDAVGYAKVIANYANDLPLANALGKEFSQLIRGLGAAYNYSLQDIRASLMSGAQLDVRRAMAARRAIENLIDTIAAFGIPESGIPGMLNNANVDLFTVTTGAWASATPQEILADLRELEQAITIATNQVFKPNTLLMDQVSYALITTTELDPTNNSTIAEQYLKTSPNVKSIDQWWVLDTADAAGTGPRLVMYDKSPETLTLVIPQEFEQLPPQAKGLVTEVSCHARIGGVSVHYPLAMVYCDNHL